MPRVTLGDRPLATPRCGGRPGRGPIRAGWNYLGMNEWRRLTRGEASAAVTDLGWRFVLGVLCTSVPVGSLPEAVEVAARASVPDADGRLRVDIRTGWVLLTIAAPGAISVTARETGLAARVTAALAEAGHVTSAAAGQVRSEAGAGAGAAPRSVQVWEIAIDALDIPAIRPFWQAVLGYVDETEDAGPASALVDPWGQGPAIWFQQMDAPRPQRNRIHVDISVPHDEADRRLRAALAAGGVLVYDVDAPAYWVLADAEGNEVCVTTWQGRD
jgi:4a-hydroxytetrahydrobiopterin dehydratase